MENATEVRFQCPSCDGKMAVEPADMLALLGRVLSCPHCENELRVNLAVENVAPKVKKSTVQHATFRVNRQMTESQLVQTTPDGAVYCPYCHVEVGKRDRACTTCGKSFLQFSQP